jgi:hypothetical protein
MEVFDGESAAPAVGRWEALLELFLETGLGEGLA